MSPMIKLIARRRFTGSKSFKVRREKKIKPLVKMKKGYFFGKKNLVTKLINKLKKKSKERMVIRLVGGIKKRKIIKISNKKSIATNIIINYNDKL